MSDALAILGALFWCVGLLSLCRKKPNEVVGATITACGAVLLIVGIGIS